MLRNFVPGDVRGAWQWLAVLARVAFRRTIMGCDEYVQVELESSAFNMFKADTVPSNGLIGKK